MINTMNLSLSFRKESYMKISYAFSFETITQTKEQFRNLD